MRGGETNGVAKAPPSPDIRDEPEFLFLMAAAVAWAEIYEETGIWPPEPKLVKRRANELYEAERRKSVT